MPCMQSSSHEPSVLLLQVRVDAVMAARSFIDAYSEEAVGEIKSLIPALLDQIFKLMAEVNLIEALCLVLTVRHAASKWCGPCTASCVQQSARGIVCPQNMP
jgi:hypothetical protein